MKNQVKKIIATCAAVAFSVSVFAACAPTPGNTYDEEGFSVVADYNDGVSRPRTYYTAEGGSINEPAAPEREGYTITGWSTDADGNNVVTFPYTPSGDTTLYAQWKVDIHTVFVDYGYSGVDNLELSVEYGSAIEQPDEPERQGMFIYRWHIDTPEGAEAVFPYTVRRDTTLCAEWRSNTDVSNVTFNFNFDGAPESTSVRLVSEPLVERLLPELDREGYELAGWALAPDAGVNDVITLPYQPSGDVTLYAVWQLGTYNVTYNINYTGAENQIYLRQPVTGWDEITEPTPPVRVQDGYTFNFLGWFTSAAEGTQVQFPYTVTRTTNFYAHWEVQRLSPTNNIFDAEFTPIASDTPFAGYSGGGMGPGGCVQSEDGFMGSTTTGYPRLLGESQCTGFYAGFLYVPQTTLTFRIYSDATVSNATLIARLATEIVRDVVLTSADGDLSYQFRVNGENIDYGQISFVGLPDTGRSDQYSNAFREYTIGNISLNAGWNTIELVTNNSNPLAQGTTSAYAPMVDYIRIETSATLSWNPVFDNLYSLRGIWQ